MPIKVFDNSETFSRFTIEIDGNVFGASSNPFSPQGFGQYCGSKAECYRRNRNWGKAVKFENLPDKLKEWIEMIKN